MPPAGDPRLLAPLSGPASLGEENPYGTTPAPAPNASYRPVGYWADAQPTAVKWQAGSGQVSYSGYWGTPILDLRPDTKGATSESTTGAPMNRLSGAQLFVMISGLSSNHLGLNVYAVPYGHPVSSRNVKQIGPAVDYTAQIATGLDTALLAFFPPNAGYPLRFWQLRLRFDWIAAGGDLPVPLPRLSVQGGMY